MTGFTLTTFGGKAPKVYARLLPEDMAQTATNVRLDSGRLEPWKGNASASTTGVLSGTISGTTKSLFKYSDALWIAHNDELDIIRSPIAEDPHERLYITGMAGSAGYPRMTTAAIAGNGTYYRLGLPDPSNISSVTLSPATSTKVNEEVPQSRSYLYTFISAYGEEGASSVPQAVNVVDVYSDQTATINFPSAPSGNYNITKRRLYRTDSNGTYRFVKDLPISSSSTTDNLAEASLGEEIPTSSFIAPPDDVSADHPDGPMLGLVSLPNGILAGFSGQTVCFSEAFQPHAFPEDYKLTVKSDIVALAPLQMGILVLTKEKPAIIQGLDPAAMSMTEIDSTLSCVAKRSVVDMGQAVIYASPDGLVLATDGGLELITQSLFTRDQWQAFSPSSIVAFHWEGHYVGFYNNGSVQKGFIFDPRGGKNSFVDLDFYASAGFNDLANDELYLIVNGSLVKFASGSALSYTWKTKKFYIPRPINPGVAKVDCDSYSSTPTLKLYADGVLKHTQTVTDADLFRLPSGYKAKQFEVELTGSTPINEICIYESAEEVGV